MRYAFISGDKYTKFDPLVLTEDNGKYEFICKSFDRQKYWYSFFESNPPESLESFLATFSYQNVEYGDVTNEVQSLLNKLRARYALEHIAQAEASKPKDEQSETEQSLLSIAKRMRTGQNERGK